MAYPQREDESHYLFAETIWSSSMLGRYFPPKVEMKSSAFTGALAAKALMLLLDRTSNGSQKQGTLLDDMEFMCNNPSHLSNFLLCLPKNAVGCVCWVRHENCFLTLRCLGSQYGQEEERDSEEHVKNVELHLEEVLAGNRIVE